MRKLVCLYIRRKRCKKDMQLNLEDAVELCNREE
jgi:hypothetical protein